MTATENLNLASLTASELQTLLQEGKLTSVELVKRTLDRIKEHDQQGMKLKALISVVPDELALETAAKLDAERAAGNTRGPLHGIPVLVKDVIRTHSDLGMPTTIGSFSLVSAKSNASATIVDKMLEKGLIIIGKTNLNELSSWKAMGPMNGWSAVGGQTNSAYVEGGLDPNDGVMGHTNPCGASTGSAVGVSAGFSPVALGTEVDGSLVQPSARAALYALKPTIGATELDGIFAVSEEFDSLGAMAKSPLDLAHMIEMVLNPQARSKLPSEGYLPFMTRSFQDLTIGFVDPAQWRWPENVQPHHGNSQQQITDGYLNAIERINNLGGKTVFPVSLPPVSELLIDGQPATILAIRHVFKANFDKFLSSYNSAEVQTAEDIMQYNKDHAEQELPPGFPEQGRLVDTLNNPISEQVYQHAKDICRTVARDNGIDKALAEHGLDLIALPMDSPSPRIAAAAGYPIATVPLGKIDYNGRPFGLSIIAKAGREDLIFTFMSAFEAAWEPRVVPPKLVH